MESVQDRIRRAWSLFERQQMDESRRLYLECLKETGNEDASAYSSVLMGLVYVESFTSRFETAREYVQKLLETAQNTEEQHIYLHQSGLVETHGGELRKSAEDLW